MIVDMHVHSFPDDLAPRAIPQLAAGAGIEPAHAGTTDALRKSMAHAGIDLAVVQHIATKPGQEQTINDWAASIQADDLLSFGTIHPDSPDWRTELRRIKTLGLRGIKFHPDYQAFFVDEQRMFPIYEEICALGLIGLFHAGIDICLPNPCHCPPARLRRVVEAFPAGRWIAAHLGGYRLWDEAAEHLYGRPLYLDTSYSWAELGPERMRAVIRRHGVEKVLFGTDSPWVDQASAVERLGGLGLTADETAAVMGENAVELLSLG